MYRHFIKRNTILKWENTYVENSILNISSFTWQTVLMIFRYEQQVQWKTKSIFWIIIATNSKVTSIWIFSVYGHGPRSISMIWLPMCLWKNGHISRKLYHKKRIFILIYIDDYLGNNSFDETSVFSVGFNIFRAVFSSHEL